MSDLTEVEQLRLQLTEAEATRLNLEWKLGEAKAALADAKGVVTAAEAWRDWFPHVDSMFAPENTLIAAVDASRVGASGAQRVATAEQDAPRQYGAVSAEIADMLERAWNIIANVGVHVRNNWDSEHPEWVEAAQRWRDEQYFPWLRQYCARRALTSEQTEASDKKRAEVEAELFRAGVHPGVESCTERNGFGRPCLLPKHGDERVCLFPGRAGVA